MSNEKSKPGPVRGRPREFQRDEALDAALATFWERGFAGASLEHLTTAMDINRPSLYGAFGDKEHLYAASVDRYVATIGQSYFAPLAPGVPLAAGLTGFFDAVIDVVTGKHGPLGCVVACTLPAEAGISAAARDQLARVLAQLDDALRARLRAAQAAGEIARGRDVRALAEVATSGMLSISIRARAGAGRRELRRLARSFVELITAPSA